MREKKYENGMIVGRFQPFHLEHLRFAAAAARKVNHLWVGITFPFGHYVHEMGKARTADEANPLPYWLRLKCVESALLNDAKLSRGSFSILAAPLVPGIIETLVPKGTVYLATVVEPWDKQKEGIFLKAGFRVLLLKLGDKTISGTMIRKKIRLRDKSWKKYIPQSIRKQYAFLIDDYVCRASCSGTYAAGVLR